MAISVYKLIPALRERLDKCRLIGTIAQYLADFQYVFSDAFRIYIRLWPQRLQKFVQRDQAICVFDQVAKNIERLGGKRHTFIVPPQPVADGVKPKRPECFHIRTVSRSALQKGRVLECDRYCSTGTNHERITPATKCCFRASTKIGRKRSRNVTFRFLHSRILMLSGRKRMSFVLEVRRGYEEAHEALSALQANSNNKPGSDWGLPTR